MATQYTSILKLALPVQGELSGTWGDVVNDNITSMVEEAIAGRAVINTWTANSHTLTTADGTTSESRAAILTLTDTGTALTGAGTVICPAASKIYIVENGTGQTITVKTSSGTGVAVPNTKNMVVFCDGTNVEEGITNINSLTLNGDGATVSSIKDEDNMASDSATALATQQSIKAYVDSQVGANNELSEVLANGNTSGGTGLTMSSGDDLTLTGASYNAVWDSSDNALEFGDNAKAVFGAGSDLQIYHDGSNSYIAEGSGGAGTGDIIIRASNFQIQNGPGTLAAIKTFNGGTTELYHSGSRKLATTSTGIDVTGTVTADGLTVDGDTLLKASGTNTTPLKVFSDNSATNNTTTIEIGDFTGGGVYETPRGSIVGQRDSAGNGGLLTLTTGESSAGTLTNRININSGGDITFYDTDGSTASFVYDADAGLTINEAGADRDFRVESDNQSHMLFVDGGNDRVGIGQSSPAYKLDVSTSTTGDGIRVFSAGGTPPSIDIGSTRGASADVVLAEINGQWDGGEVASIKFESGDDTTNKDDGRISFYTAVASNSPAERMRIEMDGSIGVGTDSPSTILHVKSSSPAFLLQDSSQTGRQTQLTQASGIAKVRSRNNASNGQIVFEGYTSSDSTEYARFDGNGTFLTKFGATFNEDSADVDFRVESNTNTHALYLDAGTSKIGINTSSPDFMLEVGDPNSGVAADIAISSGGTTEKRLVFKRSTVEDFVLVEDASENLSLNAGLSGKEFVINNTSTDLDFRVESDGNENMLFVDAGNNSVNIAGASDLTAGNLIVTGSANAASAAHRPAILGRGSYGGGIASLDTLESGWYQITSGTVWNFYHARNTSSETPDSKIVQTFNSGETVFNESSRDLDFRVESDNDNHAFFVDAGNDRVGIRESGPEATLHVNARTNSLATIIEGTAGGSGDGPQLMLWRNSGSPADGDGLGSLLFSGEDDGGNRTTYAQIRSEASDVSNGSEDGLLSIRTTVSGSDTARINLGASTVINEGGANIDFRVESNNQTHAIFVDAGNDTVNINRSSGPAALNVQSDSGADGIAVYGRSSDEISQITMYNSSGTGLSQLQTRPQYFDIRSLADVPVIISPNSSGKFYVYSGETVVNENSADHDFRVESDSNSHMLFVDAGNNRVGIGKAPLTNALDVSTSMNIEGDASPSGNGLALGDYGTTGSYKWIQSFNSQPLRLNPLGNEVSIGVSGTGANFKAFGNAVFNEDGGSTQDFRVESDNNTHMLFVDASTDRVGIGRSTPDVALHVETGQSNEQFHLQSPTPGMKFIDSNLTTRCFTIGGENGDVSIHADPNNASSSSHILIRADGSTIARFDGDGLKFGTDTAAASALDDYEEGTWTPVYEGSTTTGTGTYTRQSGVYVKVGDLVYASCTIGISAHTGAGNARVSGLPFASFNSAGNYAAISVGFNNGHATTSGYQIIGFVQIPTAVVHLYETGGTGQQNALAIDTAFTELDFTIVYRAS